jgi:signal transduction histidine kinase
MHERWPWKKVMPNPQVKTLSQQIRWQLLWLGTGLILACLLTLLFFAIRATTLTTDSLIQLEAGSLLRQISEQPALPLPQSKTFSAYRHWNEIPESLRQHFIHSPSATGKSIEALIPGTNGDQDYLYLMRHTDDAHGEIFLLSRYTSAEIDTVSLAFFKSALNQSLWLTLFIFLSLYFLVRWLIRRTTEPLAMLSQWAADLGKHPNQPLQINFPIEELNQLASQLHEGVGKIQAFNEREQQFLQHASHEMRTPLAIIQASLDTLDLQNNKTDRVPVQRALRASANMRRLSAALLWLARESERPIDKSDVMIRERCNQLIDDHRYLLDDREIDVQTHIRIDTLEIEADLFLIVLTNLLRNAFQHSADGIIHVDMSAKGLEISNPVKEAIAIRDRSMATGFGLGLQLVKRICQKLDWQFNYSETSRKVVVRVAWGLLDNDVEI